jgi:hypothetical protein
MKPFAKGHNSGGIVSFVHFCSEILLLLSRSQLTCEAALWAYDRFSHESWPYLMPTQHIPQVERPQEQCMYCWYLLNPLQPYPEAGSSTCCLPHSAWLINLSAQRRARRAAAPEVMA